MVKQSMDIPLDEICYYQHQKKLPPNWPRTKFDCDQILKSKNTKKIIKRLNTNIGNRIENDQRK